LKTNKIKMGLKMTVSGSVYKEGTPRLVIGATMNDVLFWAYKDINTDYSKGL
jgi:hypothetical protein